MMGAILGCFLGMAAWSDWQRRKVPNWLLFPMMLSGLSVQIAMGQGARALGGLACGFAIALLPVLLRSMGMGDQKLLMAIGAWTSASDVYCLFLVSAGLCLVMLVLAPGRLASFWSHFRAMAAGWFGQREVWIPSCEQSAMAVPFAVLLAGSYLLRQVGGMLA